MRTVVFTMILSLLVLIYGLLNYYIGLRGWQFFSEHIYFLTSKIYWLVFWLIATSYILGRLCEIIFPGKLAHILKYIGSYWLAIMFYAILVLLIVDILRLLLGRLVVIPSVINGFLILFAIFGIVLYGTLNALNPQVTNYDITISKQAGNYNNLKAVLVADIHLGTIVNDQRLNRMVDEINGLNPDLVLLAGDIIDEDVEVFAEQQMAKSLSRLNAKLGIYAVLGNHEYIGNNAKQAVNYLQQAGIIVLKDSYFEVGDSFYVVGRKDKAVTRFMNENRKDLLAVLEGVDKSKPIILLDHQPTNLAEAQEAGVDLQVSGHTHRGQLFPNHLITRKVFEVDWGYLQKEDFQVIVTCGYGTWGPPIRVGNKPELVLININFNT